jgi:hypothetical protein
MVPCGIPKSGKSLRVSLSDFEQQIKWCHMPPLNVIKNLGLEGELVAKNKMLPCDIYHCGSNFKVLKVEFSYTTC